MPLWPRQEVEKMLRKRIGSGNRPEGDQNRRLPAMRQDDLRCQEERASFARLRESGCAGILLRRFRSDTSCEII
jgi:hypothetical protein